MPINVSKERCTIADTTDCIVVRFVDGHSDVAKAGRSK